jgi:alpha-glucosidase
MFLGQWYNYWTNDFVNGGKEILILNLTKFQCLYKAGAIIPKYPVQQYVGELEFDELTLDLYIRKRRSQWCMKMHKMAMITKKVGIVS